MFANPQHLLTIQNVIGGNGICVCFVGEIALNFYNVDRVVNDIEVCVPHDSLHKAMAALIATSGYDDYTYTSDPSNREELNIFNAYKIPYPRLLCKTRDSAAGGKDFIHVCLLPDTLFFTIPLNEVLIPRTAHLQHSAYSDHALDLLSAGDNPSAFSKLNIPRLGPLFNAFLHHFVKSGCEDYNAAMLAESLVDGMDIDGQWCDAGIPEERDQELAFARQLVASKAQRLNYQHPNGVTAFLNTREDAQKMRLVPGRDL